MMNVMGKEDDDDDALLTAKNNDDDASMKSSLVKSLFEGVLRVNPHDPSEAYVSVSFLPVDVKFRLFHDNTNDHQDEDVKKKKKIFAVDQDKILFTLESPIEWLRQELREKSEAKNRRERRPGSTIGRQQRRGTTKRYDFVSRDDGKMLDSRERRKRETVRELVQKLRTWNRGRGAKAYEGACRFFSSNSSNSNGSGSNKNNGDGIEEIELLRPIGTVVKIIEPSPKRTRLVGYIVDEKRNNTNSNTNSKNKSKKSFRLKPTDSRMPTCDIDASLSELKDLENVPENVIVFASMIDTDGTAKGALSRACSVERIIGPSDSIETHTAKIILENDIKDEPFTDEVLACLRKSGTTTTASS